MRIAIVRSGWGLALALLLAQGCAQPGKSKTTAELGITSPQFRVTHETDTTGTTLDVDGGSAGADFCFELDWIGSDGAVLSSSYVTTGGTGHFAAQVPVGTVRMEGIYYKCPDLDGGGESDEGGGEGDGEGDGRAISPPRCLQPQTQGTRQGRETDRAMSVEIREYGLISMPLGLTSGKEDSSAPIVCPSTLPAPSMRRRSPCRSPPKESGQQPAKRSACRSTRGSSSWHRG